MRLTEQQRETLIATVGLAGVPFTAREVARAIRPDGGGYYDFGFQRLASLERRGLVKRVGSDDCGGALWDVTEAGAKSIRHINGVEKHFGFQEGGDSNG